MNKQLFLTLALIFSLWNNAFAQHVPSMLEKGNEWSYYTLWLHFKDSQFQEIEYVPYFYHYYIDGEETIGGNRYQKIWCEWENADFPPTWLESTSMSPCIAAHLREEDGKILAPTRDFPTYDYIGKAVDGEYIVYDWNWEDGANIMDMMRLKLSDTPFITNDNISRKFWNGCILEGIGATKGLAMLTHHLYNYSVLLQNNRGWIQGACLNVFAKNGEIIYKAPFFTESFGQEESCTTYKPDPYFGHLVEEQITNSADTQYLIAPSRPAFDISGRMYMSGFHNVSVEGSKKVIRFQ